MNKYDVIILGAGPAGLSIASELSKTLKVLVIDSKKEIGKTTKSWLIPDLVIQNGNAKDLMPYMYNGVKRFTTKTFGGAHVTWDAILKYHYTHEPQLLDYWGNIIDKNGSEVMLDCWYTHHSVKEGDDKVIVDARINSSNTELQLQAKMFVDASGGASPVHKDYPNLFNSEEKNYLWWSVYGYIVDMPDGLGDMRNGDYMLWQTFRDSNEDPETSLAKGRPCFEYEILDERTAFAFIFYLMKDKIDKNTMKEKFMRILYEEDSTKDFHSATLKEEKWGWYPSGGPHAQSLAADRVSFVGNAGCWTTPCGWGMTMTLANYKRYAARLAEAVKSDQLRDHHLKQFVQMSYHNDTQVLLDQITTHFLSYASASLLDQFIELFAPNGVLKEDGPLYCEKLFTMTLSEKEALRMLVVLVENFDKEELLKAIPEKEYGQIAELAGEFVDEGFLDIIRKILNFFRSLLGMKKIKHPVVNGFLFK